MSDCNTIMTRLKTETHDEHVATEGIALSQAMLHGKLTVEQHALQIQMYARLSTRLEHEIKHGTLGPYQPVWQPYMSKLSSLRLDVEQLAKVLHKIPKPVTITTAVAVKRLRQDAGHPARLLGWLYVLEGATLGTSSLIPCLVKVSESLAGRGLNYYRVYGDQTSTYWGSFCDRMSGAVTPEATQDVVEGARRAFAAVRSVFEVVDRVTTTPQPLAHCREAKVPLPARGGRLGSHHR